MRIDYQEDYPGELAHRLEEAAKALEADAVAAAVNLPTSNTVAGAEIVARTADLIGPRVLSMLRDVQRVILAGRG